METHIMDCNKKEASVELPKVIAIKVVNKSTKVLPVKLLGALENINAPNFNNVEGIEVSDSYLSKGHMEYKDILIYAIHSSNSYSLMRIVDTGDNEQLEQALLVHTMKDGSPVCVNVNKEMCYIDPFGRDQSKIRDLIHDFEIDGHTEITFDMLPMVDDKPNEFHIYIFPKPPSHTNSFPIPTILKKIKNMKTRLEQFLEDNNISSESTEGQLLKKYEDGWWNVHKKYCTICHTQLTYEDTSKMSVMDYNYTCKKHKHLAHVFNLDVYKERYGSFEFVAKDILPTI